VVDVEEEEASEIAEVCANLYPHTLWSQNLTYGVPQVEETSNKATDRRRRCWVR
jgi:hypothetical protein